MSKVALRYIRNEDKTVRLFKNLRLEIFTSPVLCPMWPFKNLIFLHVHALYHKWSSYISLSLLICSTFTCLLIYSVWLKVCSFISPLWVVPNVQSNMVFQITGSCKKLFTIITLVKTADVVCSWVVLEALFIISHAQFMYLHLKWTSPSCFDSMCPFKTTLCLVRQLLHGVL